MFSPEFLKFLISYGLEEKQITKSKKENQEIKDYKEIFKYPKLVTIPIEQTK